MTGIIKKEPAPAALGSTSIEQEENRDQTIETEFFPIFREGQYPQGEYTRKDIDEIVEEFRLMRRRSPIVFDHLNEEDMAENSKPGPAVGYVIELRASSDTTPEYKGKRLLECRAKASWWASYRTRSGDYRNCSVGLYHHKSHVDQKERLALHHLALLGAQPPGVEGLPEIVFSAATSQSRVKNVSFSLGSDFRIEQHSAVDSRGTNPRENNVDPITFSEHEARVSAVRSELTLVHGKEITSFKEQVTQLNTKLTKFQEDLEASQADVAAAKAETETVKAGIPAAVEAAKQAGVVEGITEGEARTERLFAEKTEKVEIENFCQALRQEGKITEPELTGDGKSVPALAQTILSIPVGAAREQFKSLLLARPALAPKAPVKGPSSVNLFSQRKPEVQSSEGDPVAQEQADTNAARELVREGKFSNFRAAYTHVTTQKEA